ncbi:MAG: 2-C-methyl-D-erythritol 4-phosphate cytidylyltransferase [Candidatus Atribacteria bacterium]|nr:2-C-methyl-D-erythritol 4-phosphate cytidylyltransferase [Candidatus Atribacteria bacterium]
MFYALIVAAGMGERMNSVVPKQYLPVSGKPVLAHTIDVFEKSPLIDEIVMVINAHHESVFREQIQGRYRYTKVKQVIFGGQTRQDSVYEGLRLLRDRPEDYVLIHDGVRPLIDEQVLRRCVKKLVEQGAVCCAVPSSDTLKVMDDGMTIHSTLDRSQVWRAQTPQSFRISVIWEAYQRARAEGFQGTDDSCLVERMGLPVFIVLGSEDNFKITTPQDFLRAEERLRWKTS